MLTQSNKTRAIKPVHCIVQFLSIEEALREQRARDSRDLAAVGQERLFRLDRSEKLRRNDSQKTQNLFEDFVDQTIIKGLANVELFRFGMLDKLEGVRHRLFDHPDRAGESLAVVFETTLQRRVVVDSRKALERALADRRVVVRELLGLAHRAQKIHRGLVVLRILQPGLARADNGRGKQSVFGLRRAKQQMKAGVLRVETERIADHADVHAAGHQRSVGLADTAVLNEDDF